ncbi:hypothetical protein ACS0TY_027958 [Phlomoides rotata]
MSLASADGDDRCFRGGALNRYGGRAVLMAKSEREVDELVREPSVESLAATETPDFCLVGRFLTDQPINFSLMNSRMASIWRPKKGLYVKDIGEGRYVFQFFHRMDVKCVEDGSPWSFGTYMLLLHRLDKWDLPLQVPLLWVKFWVHVYNLPLGFFSERIGQQALKCGKCIKTADISVFVVNFKYEKLNQFCFVCGHLGHTKNLCEVVFNTPEGEDIRRDWGTWLKAPDRRWLRGEAGGMERDSMSRGAGGRENMYAGAGTEEADPTMEEIFGYLVVVNPTFVDHADKENFELTITDTKKHRRQMVYGDVGSSSGSVKEIDFQVAVGTLEGARRES